MGRLRAALARIGVRTPFGRDALGAALLTFAQVAVLVVLAADVTPLELVLLVGAITAASAPFSLRRQRPVLALLLSAAVAALWSAIAMAAGIDHPLPTTSPAVSLLAYSAAAYTPRGVAFWGISAAAVVGVAGPLQLTSVAIATVVSVTMTVYVVPGLIGAYVRSRREYVGELTDRLRAAERERDALAGQAVAEERTRIARELHDVAAHHLSSIVVQAGAAERMVDRDPDAVRESLAFIRSQGKETLASMRLLVGILRAGESGELAPQPTMQDLTELVDRLRAEGFSVTLQIDVGLSAMPAGVGVTVYRVVQEALSNLRTHAPGAEAAVRIVRSAHGLCVDVRNGPSPERPHRTPSPEERVGHGLIGMSERAFLIGGKVSAGPLRDGGWRVRLEVPAAELETEEHRERESDVQKETP